MSTYTTTEHKNTDVSPVNDSSRPNSRVESFPATPMVHAVEVFVQLEDGNELYEQVDREIRKLNGLRNEPGTTDCPHLVETGFHPSWDKQGRECEIGLFSSTTGYGKIDDDGNLIRTPDHHLGLYDDALAAKKPPMPAKCKLVIEKREHGLQNTNGGEFQWPPGVDGNRWEGTHLKIQTSYISEPMDALNRAEEMLSAAFKGFNTFDEIGHLIPEMCRVRGVEAYLRYDRDLAEATIRELEKSANLTVEGDVRGDRYLQHRNGEYTNYGLKTTRFETLGFDTTDLNGSPNSIQLKTYAATRHNDRAKDDPLRHWKLEATINGAFPWDDWSAVRHHAERIVCSHAMWTGIREEELVPDEWFLADVQSEQPLTFRHPTGRREQLIEFYESASFERTVRGRLFHSRTMSYYDLLCVLLHRANKQITYQEVADEIGLTKDSIGRIAKKLEDDGIITRSFSAVGILRWQSKQSREMVRQLLDRDMTEAERRVEIEKRAAERRGNRENASKETTNEDETEQWVNVSESEVSVEELTEGLRSGVISPENVSIRPGG